MRTALDGECFSKNTNLEDGLPGLVYKWLGSPLFTSHKNLRPFIKGITPVMGLTNHGPWLLTTYKSWDDPPSRSEK